MRLGFLEQKNIPISLKKQKRNEEILKFVIKSYFKHLSKKLFSASGFNNFFKVKQQVCS